MHAMDRTAGTRFALLMRGLPGSGKSTAASALAALVPGSRIVSADQHMFEGGRPFSLDRLGECHLRCRADLRLAIKQKVPLVVVDNTHLKADDVRPYVRILHLANVPFGIVELRTDPEVAFARNSHGVPRDVFDLLVKRLAVPLPKEWPLVSLPG